jgi:hypothetical protein
VKKFGQSNGRFLPLPFSQLQKIVGLVARGKAVNGRSGISADGQKNNLRHRQIIYPLHTNVDLFIWEIRFFEH